MAPVDDSCAFTLPMYSPRSIAIDSSISRSAERSGTRPISRRYIRTGSSRLTPERSLSANASGDTVLRRSTGASSSSSNSSSSRSADSSSSTSPGDTRSSRRPSRCSIASSGATTLPSSARDEVSGSTGTDELLGRPRCAVTFFSPFRPPVAVPAAGYWSKRTRSSSVSLRRMTLTCPCPTRTIAGRSAML